MPPMALLSLPCDGLDDFAQPLGDPVDAEAEALEHLGARRARAEALDRDRLVDVLLPAHPDAGLDGDLAHAVREDRAAIGVVLLVEELPAGHGDHAHAADGLRGLDR